MPIEKLLPSFTFTEDRLEELKVVVPEAFADGKINWETLQEALGEYLEDPDQEHFGLSWPGKREARRLAAIPSKGTLVPQPGEGVNEDSTKNIFIEGDNLEVLKLLQKSYAGRIKLIYIDPPYNTGNDFVYSDDYSEPLNSYLQKAGLVGEDGQMLSTNTKASGRLHSNWLCMMYPRLLLARQLLSKDGVIFVSIDKHEAHHLRVLMNEIYGEESFIANVSVVNNMKGRNDEKNIATAHESLMIFGKEEFVSYELPLSEEKLNEYNQVDEQGNKFQWRDLRKRGGADTRTARPNLFFPIYYSERDQSFSLDEKSGAIPIYPTKADGTEGCWRWGRERVSENIGILKASYVERSNRWNVSYKVFLVVDGVERSSKPKSVWIGSQYSTDLAQRSFRKLLPGVDFGSAPKPLGMLKEILHQSVRDDDICLDFFAGTCSMGQAVMEFNRESGNNVKFIMVQIPELTPEKSSARKKGFITIADIGRERLRRAISVSGKKEEGKLEFEWGEDLGFHCFGLDKSNYKDWQLYEDRETRQLETLFDQFETPLVDGWTPQNLLVEVMLFQGFPLDSNIIPLDDRGNNIQRVHSSTVAHDMFVCLDKKIEDETIQRLQLRPEDIFVCLDSALSDEAKIKLADQCNLIVI
jgi:adenine-specific DNA-methyltransferase